MEAAELDVQLDELENRLERLRALYEQYFMGIEKLEPTIPRKDVDRRIWFLRREKIRNTAKRFKLQTLIQRYNTFQQYWQRICREIENGTYKRHLLRVEKKFGTKNLLTIASRRRLGRAGREEEAAAEAEGVAQNGAGAGPDQNSHASAPPPSTPTASTPLASPPASAPSPSGPPRVPPPPPRATPGAPLPPPGALSRALPPPVPGPKPLPPPVPGQKPLSPPRAPLAPPPRPTRPAAPSGEGTTAPATPPVAAAPAPPIAAPAKPVTPPPKPAQPSAPKFETLDFDMDFLGDWDPAKAKTPEQAPKPSVEKPLAASPTAPKPAQRAARPAKPAERVPAKPAPAAALSDDRIRELQGRLNDLKRQNQEAGQVSYDGLAKSLKATEEKLRKQHGQRKIDFDVVLKDGKAVVKPIIR